MTCPSDTKVCFKCGQTKSRTDFYAHSQMADGLLGKCKECTKNDSTARRLSKLDEIREYDRRRGLTEDRRRKVREYAAKNLEVVGAAKKRYIIRYPEKAYARTAIGNALRDGRLVKQPCEVCGDPKSEGHHDDYSKPLEVRWLCDKHHKEHHREQRERERRLSQP